MQRYEKVTQTDVVVPDTEIEQGEPEGDTSRLNEGSRATVELVLPAHREAEELVSKCLQCLASVHDELFS